MRERKGSVVIADGDSRVRALAADSLRRAGYEAVEVETGVDALAAAHAGGVALIIVEVELPDISGYEICHGLRQQAGQQLSIFLTSGSRTEPLDRVAGLLLGADDFLVKPFDPSELTARVARFVSRPAAQNGGDPRASAPHLTEREREVLGLLAQGVTQKDVAQRLSISPKTVATHIQNLLGKLGVHSRAELVARAYRLGLVTQR